MNRRQRKRNRNMGTNANNRARGNGTTYRKCLRCGKLHKQHKPALMFMDPGASPCCGETLVTIYKK